MATNRLRRGLQATYVGLVVNLFLAAGKLVGGIAGHSQALVADAVESFADVFSALVVWRGLVIAHQPADEEHPYGHGKAEPIAAATVAGMLVVAAIAIVIQAAQEIWKPHQRPAPFTLVVLLLVVLIKEALFRFVLREARAIESSAVSIDAWHHRSDAITSLAAGIGISISLLGGPGYEIADDLAALAAAGVVAWNGWRIWRSAASELMDARPDQGVDVAVRQIALGTPGVANVEKCLIRKMGNRYLVDMHVEVNPEMPVRRAHEIAHNIKDRILLQMPAILDVLIHIEPAR